MQCTLVQVHDEAQAVTWLSTPMQYPEWNEERLKINLLFVSDCQYVASVRGRDQGLNQGIERSSLFHYLAVVAQGEVRFE